HASLQGWGGWEVNLNYIFQAGEAANLLSPPPAPPQYFGRYGSDAQPTKIYGPDGLAGNHAPAPRMVPFYSAINYSGAGGGAPTLPLTAGQTSPAYTGGYQSGPIT